MNRNLVAFILLVIAVGVYFTVTDKMVDDAVAVKDVNDRYTAAIADAARLVTVRDQVLDEYNTISVEDRDRLDKLVPSSVDNIRLIIDLNNVAQRNGFSLSNIKAVVASDEVGDNRANRANRAGEGVSVPTLDKVAVSFTAVAPYNQFVSFLTALEANLRIMDVTSLSVSANDSGSYTFETKLDTYWIRQ